MRFHSVEAVILLSQKFWKTCDYRAPYQAMPSKIISMLSLTISILHAKFCTFTCNRVRVRIITRLKKIVLRIYFLK